MRDLRAHTRQCAACEAHLTFGRKVAVGLASRGEDRMRDERAIALTMSSVTRWARRGHVRPIWILAAALVCIAGAASAGWWMGRGHLDLPVASLSSVASPAAALHRQLVAIPSVTSLVVARGADPSAGDKQPRSTSVDPNDTAASLFAQANELRRGGKDDPAILGYRKLQRLFPGTPQADQSHATLGLLLLQRLHPDEALTQFDHYLAHDGLLAEDVLVGRALCLQHLGRSNEERRTWESVLHRFPGSIHVARAKTRLTELSTPGAR